MKQTLNKVLYLYIHRDPLDDAISILNARRKYYSDPNTWWSYIPVEYEQLKDLNYWEQIAGQIYYLTAFYKKQIEKIDPQIIINIEYEDLCKKPEYVLKNIQMRCISLYDYKLEIINEIQNEFSYRTYMDRYDEKEKFKHLIAKFGEKDN